MYLLHASAYYTASESIPAVTMSHIPFVAGTKTAAGLELETQVPVVYMEIVPDAEDIDTSTWATPTLQTRDL